MSVSAVQWSESAACPRISPPCWTSLPLPLNPTHGGRHRALSWECFLKRSSQRKCHVSSLATGWVGFTIQRRFGFLPGPGAEAKAESQQNSADQGPATRQVEGEMSEQAEWGIPSSAELWDSGLPRTQLYSPSLSNDRPLLFHLQSF